MFNQIRKAGRKGIINCQRLKQPTSRSSSVSSSPSSTMINLSKYFTSTIRNMVNTTTSTSTLVNTTTSTSTTTSTRAMTTNSINGGLPPQAPITASAPKVKVETETKPSSAGYLFRPYFPKIIH